tara:strand:+ start:2939 stop:3250 length:312 start_codon:yes stop_codon:yes gene_type:complete
MEGIKETEFRSEQRIMMDVNVTLALVKCLSEQIHGMRWDYKQNLKNKFNKLFKVVKQYENEINKSMDETNDESIELIYDAFMDSICESKEIALLDSKQNNVEK